VKSGQKLCEYQLNQMRASLLTDFSEHTEHLSLTMNV